ncbi:hypothetical protein RFI_05430 [Reticulomyxa filosa]|uniref:Uncharacterized protein n=1 Tax=Reticulomyxa filosa TaxID=46433 RepID=X6P2A2_RETFI|nr:hypothetical protein RFI_05430 [Reticulomyxa filosa]|eukprot:ETO31687.1 hypothetical protein RFI_05430 [Reticulomyxa filosa]
MLYLFKPDLQEFVSQSQSKKDDIRPSLTVLLCLVNYCIGVFKSLYTTDHFVSHGGLASYLFSQYLDQGQDLGHAAYSLSRMEIEKSLWTVLSLAYLNLLFEIDAYHKHRPQDLDEFHFRTHAKLLHSLDDRLTRLITNIDQFLLQQLHMKSDDSMSSNLKRRSVVLSPALITYATAQIRFVHRIRKTLHADLLKRISN